VDGGLVAQDPALIAAHEAFTRFGATQNNTLLVSLGCGHADVAVSFSEVSSWGAWKWARYLPTALMNSSVLTVDEHVRMVLPKDKYFRFDTMVDANHSRLDDVKSSSLKYYVEKGVELVEKRKEDLNGLVSLLVQTTAM